MSLPVVREVQRVCPRPHVGLAADLPGLLLVGMAGGAGQRPPRGQPTFPSAAMVSTILTYPRIATTEPSPPTHPAPAVVPSPTPCDPTRAGAPWLGCSGNGR